MRLRVELTDDYDKIPPQRFGAEFVGQVANADDIVQYTKRKARSDVTDTNVRSQAAILKSRYVCACEMFLDAQVFICLFTGRGMRQLRSRRWSKRCRAFCLAAQNT